MHLRELWRLRPVAAACLAVAVFCGLSAFYTISIFPPGLEPRALDLATAQTQVLVDTPSSTVLDLRQDTSSFEAITNRATLLGNVMVSAPVLDYIAKRARISPGAIRATTPLTPEFPRPFAEEGRTPKTSDIVRLSNEYRLSIRANPTVPVLTVIAQAPDARAATTLADAAVDGLRDYLGSVAATQGTAPANRVTLQQLGRAHGKVINRGQRIQAAAVFFLAGFGLSAVVLLLLVRVGRGWRAATRPDSSPPPSADVAVKGPQSSRRAQDGDLVIR